MPSLTCRHADGGGASDPRYRANVRVGMRVVIKMEGNPDLAPCHVREIITKDHKNELGVMVSCEDGCTGRVRYIGTETAYMSPMDLITSLETKLRSMIVGELSRDDPDWWNVKIHPTIRERVDGQKRRGKEYRRILQIPECGLMEEVYFSELHMILLSKKNWKNHFERIFRDADALRVKMSELSSCRNLPAHSKEITGHLERKIQVYYDDIVSLMEGHERLSAGDSVRNAGRTESARGLKTRR